jgi:hypothetical protein
MATWLVFFLHTWYIGVNDIRLLILGDVHADVHLRPGLFVKRDRTHKKTFEKIIKCLIKRAVAGQICHNPSPLCLPACWPS